MADYRARHPDPSTVARSTAQEPLPGPFGALVTASYCPLLRFGDDPTSRYSRPTRLHRCFTRAGARQVSLREQRDWCLTDRFVDCLWFSPANAAKMAEALSPGGSVRQHGIPDRDRAPQARGRHDRLNRASPLEARRGSSPSRSSRPSKRLVAFIGAVVVAAATLGSIWVRDLVTPEIDPFRGLEVLPETSHVRPTASTVQSDGPHEGQEASSLFFGEGTVAEPGDATIDEAAGVSGAALDDGEDGIPTEPPFFSQ